MFSTTKYISNTLYLYLNTNIPIKIIVYTLKYYTYFLNSV